MKDLPIKIHLPLVDCPECGQQTLVDPEFEEQTCINCGCEFLDQGEWSENEIEFEAIEAFYDLLAGPSCECCGCTEDRACPSGCAWSPRFLIQDRHICTSCEPLLLMLQNNISALKILQDGKFIGVSDVREP